MRELLERWSWWILGALAVALLLAAIDTKATLLPEYVADQCGYENRRGEQQCSAYGIAQALLALLLDWLNTNQGVATGVTGALVAAFTFTLWRSTRALWRVTLDELIATHPPRIDARQVFVSPDGVDGDGDVVAEIFLANIGGNDATVITRTIVFSVGSLPTRRPFKDFNDRPLINHTVKAGAADWWRIRRDETNLTDEFAAEMARPDGRPIYVIGRVHFQDTRDAKHHTVFCRMYDRNTGRFVPTKDDDYEVQT